MNDDYISWQQYVPMLIKTKHSTKYNIVGVEPTEIKEILNSYQCCFGVGLKTDNYFLSPSLLSGSFIEDKIVYEKKRAKNYEDFPVLYFFHSKIISFTPNYMNYICKTRSGINISFKSETNMLPFIVDHCYIMTIDQNYNIVDILYDTTTSKHVSTFLGNK